MSAATNAFELDILKLIFNNTTLANIGDATGLVGSTASGNLYIALFTADPGEAGAVTNEATYTGYARKAVARTSGGWTCADAAGVCTAKNTAAITFDPCTGGSNTITHFAVCKAGTASVQDLIFYGALTASLAVSNGITPEFAIAALSVEAR